MATDWFRYGDWNEQIESEFEQRLGRSRKHNRAQYLRIQASHLEEAGQPDLVPVALRLLDRMVADYPDQLQLAMAHAQRASCFLRLGNLAAALAAYRDALEAERRFPNARTEAWLDFGWLVVAEGREELYEEARGVLEEFDDLLLFPIQRYKYHAAHALLADRGSDSSIAHARRALEAAAAETSGLRYHPDLGLVSDGTPAVHRRIERLAVS
jgi:tetratricopeptide (TPR) repeat protein